MAAAKRRTPAAARKATQREKELRERMENAEQHIANLERERHGYLQLAQQRADAIAQLRGEHIAYQRILGILPPLPDPAVTPDEGESTNGVVEGEPVEA